LAFSPPILIPPNGETNTAIQVATATNAPAENNQSKVFKIQLFITVVTDKKADRLKKLASTAQIKTKRGGRNILYLNILFIDQSYTSEEPVDDNSRYVVDYKAIIALYDGGFVNPAIALQIPTLLIKQVLNEWNSIEIATVATTCIENATG
jgi:hypothetical protein